MSRSQHIAETVPERIARAYPTMSNALRVFADFVLSEPLVTARDSMEEAVKHVGVSIATANRFARAIGYSGYSEFRSNLIQGFETVYNSVDRMEAALKEGGTAENVMSSTLAGIQENIEATRKQLTPALCESAVQLILRARRRFVLGFERASHLSAILAAELDMRCGSTSSVSNADGGVGAAMRLFDYGENDMVIASVFPRYFRETVELVRYAKRRNVRVLAITDSPRSPVASLADVSIYVNIERNFGSTSDACVLAVMEALIAGVTRELPDALTRYRALTEAVLPWYEMPVRAR